MSEQYIKNNSYITIDEFSKLPSVNTDVKVIQEMIESRGYINGDILYDVRKEDGIYFINAKEANGFDIKRSNYENYLDNSVVFLDHGKYELAEDYLERDYGYIGESYSNELIENEDNDEDILINEQEDDEIIIDENNEIQDKQEQKRKRKEKYKHQQKRADELKRKEEQQKKLNEIEENNKKHLDTLKEESNKKLEEIRQKAEIERNEKNTILKKQLEELKLKEYAEQKRRTEEQQKTLAALNGEARKNREKLYIEENKQYDKEIAEKRTEAYKKYTDDIHSISKRYNENEREILDEYSKEKRSIYVSEINNKQDQYFSTRQEQIEFRAYVEDLNTQELRKNDNAYRYKNNEDSKAHAANHGQIEEIAIKTNSNIETSYIKNDPLYTEQEKAQKVYEVKTQCDEKLYKAQINSVQTQLDFDQGKILADKQTVQRNIEKDTHNEIERLKTQNIEQEELKKRIEEINKRADAAKKEAVIKLNEQAFDIREKYKEQTTTYEKEFVDSYKSQSEEYEMDMGKTTTPLSPTERRANIDAQVSKINSVIADVNNEGSRHMYSATESHEVSTRKLNEDINTDLSEIISKSGYLSREEKSMQMQTTASICDKNENDIRNKKIKDNSYAEETEKHGSTKIGGASNVETFNNNINNAPKAISLDNNFSSPEEVGQYLQNERLKGNNVFIEYEGKKFYSADATPASVYKEIKGTDYNPEVFDKNEATLITKEELVANGIITIEQTVNYLENCRMDGENKYAEFNGVRLDSSDITMESAYGKIAKNTVNKEIKSITKSNAKMVDASELAKANIKSEADAIKFAKQLAANKENKSFEFNGKTYYAIDHTPDNSKTKFDKKDAKKANLNNSTYTTGKKIKINHISNANDINAKYSSIRGKKVVTSRSLQNTFANNATNKNAKKFTKDTSTTMGVFANKGKKTETTDNLTAKEAAAQFNGVYVRHRLHVQHKIAQATARFAMQQFDGVEAVQGIRTVTNTVSPHLVGLSILINDTNKRGHARVAIRNIKKEDTAALIKNIRSSKTFANLNEKDRTLLDKMLNDPNLKFNSKQIQLFNSLLTRYGEKELNIRGLRGASTKDLRKMLKLDQLTDDQKRLIEQLLKNKRVNGAAIGKLKSLKRASLAQFKATLRTALQGTDALQGYDLIYRNGRRVAKAIVVPYKSGKLLAQMIAARIDRKRGNFVNKFDKKYNKAVRKGNLKKQEKLVNKKTKIDRKIDKKINKQNNRLKRREKLHNKRPSVKLKRKIKTGIKNKAIKTKNSFAKSRFGTKINGKLNKFKNTKFYNKLNKAFGKTKKGFRKIGLGFDKIKKGFSSISNFFKAFKKWLIIGIGAIILIIMLISTFGGAVIGAIQTVQGFFASSDETSNKIENSIAYRTIYDSDGLKRNEESLYNTYENAYTKNTPNKINKLYDSNNSDITGFINDIKTGSSKKFNTIDWGSEDGSVPTDEQHYYTSHTDSKDENNKTYTDWEKTNYYNLGNNKLIETAKSSNIKGIIAVTEMRAMDWNLTTYKNYANLLLQNSHISDNSITLPYDNNGSSNPDGTPNKTGYYVSSKRECQTGCAYINKYKCIKGDNSTKGAYESDGLTQKENLKVKNGDVNISLSDNDNKLKDIIGTLANGKKYGSNSDGNWWKERYASLDAKTENTDTNNDGLDDKDNGGCLLTIHYLTNNGYYTTENYFDNPSIKTTKNPYGSNQTTISIKTPHNYGAHYGETKKQLVGNGFGHWTSSKNYHLEEFKNIIYNGCTNYKINYCSGVGAGFDKSTCINPVKILCDGTYDESKTIYCKDTDAIDSYKDYLNAGMITQKANGLETDGNTYCSKHTDGRYHGACDTLESVEFGLTFTKFTKPNFVEGSAYSVTSRIIEGTTERNWYISDGSKEYLISDGASYFNGAASATVKCTYSHVGIFFNSYTFSYSKPGSKYICSGYCNGHNYKICYGHYACGGHSQCLGHLNCKGNHKALICEGHVTLRTNVLINDYPAEEKYWQDNNFGDYTSNGYYNLIAVGRNLENNTNTFIPSKIKDEEKNTWLNKIYNDKLAKSYADMAYYDADYEGDYGKDVFGDIMGSVTGSNYMTPEVMTTSDIDKLLTLSKTLLNNELNHNTDKNKLQAIVSSRINIVEYALESVGRIPYYWGGKARYEGYDGNNFGTTTTPDDSEYKRSLKGLDCSGWVNWVLRSSETQGDVKTYINRNVNLPTGTGTIKNYGNSTTFNKLKPGDILVNDDHTGIFVAWNTSDGLYSPGASMWVAEETGNPTNQVVCRVWQSNVYSRYSLRNIYGD